MQTHEFKSETKSSLPDEKHQKVIEDCQKELKELVYWINRAIISSNKYNGLCVRKVKIDD